LNKSPILLRGLVDYLWLGKTSGSTKDPIPLGLIPG